MNNLDVFNHLPDFITAVGALGVAAYGIVEALGKTLVFGHKSGKPVGLPFAGYGKVDALVKLVGPALGVAYGQDDYKTTIAQQYRAGRGKGQAPETIRQGVRLGIGFMDPDEAAKVVAAVWGMPGPSATLLAQALTQPPASGGATPQPAGNAGTATPPQPGAPSSPATQLAARFATALDTRVQAAFDSAEEVYEVRAQFLAGLTAMVLSLTYEALQPTAQQNWIVAVLVGLVAVPLAPVAKDLASSLSDALTSLSKLRGKATK